MEGKGRLIAALAGCLCLLTGCDGLPPRPQPRVTQEPWVAPTAFATAEAYAFPQRAEAVLDALALYRQVEAELRELFPALQLEADAADQLERQLSIAADEAEYDALEADVRVKIAQLIGSGYWQVDNLTKNGSEVPQSALDALDGLRARFEEIGW